MSSRQINLTYTETFNSLIINMTKDIIFESKYCCKVQNHYWCFGIIVQKKSEPNKILGFKKKKKVKQESYNKNWQQFTIRSYLSTLAHALVNMN